MKAKLYLILKTVFAITAAGCAASLLWAVVHYLNVDPRFNVREISVLGLKHVAEEDVMARIQLKTASNTNIFAVDMNDVRAHVEQIPWVRYANVQRILPDRIVIRIVEREPIGLARIDGQIRAFDDEASFLEPDNAAETRFPILTGLENNDAEGNLKKIAMYLKVNSDLSDAGLSEILVDLNNEASVVKDLDPVIVKLGTEDFKERWSHYLMLKSKIDTDYKDAVRIDLRFRNQVIVRMQEDDSGKVIWDGKKKSL